MRAILYGLPLLTLVACGVDETVFIPEYTDMYCQALIDCTDPAVLVFDGMEDKDQCVGTKGPEVEDMIGYCDYSPKAAKKCLAAMENLACPGDGQTVDDIIPLDCSEALSACNPPKDKDPTTETGTTEPTTTTTGGTGA